MYLKLAFGEAFYHLVYVKGYNVAPVFLGTRADLHCTPCNGCTGVNICKLIERNSPRNYAFILSYNYVYFFRLGAGLADTPGIISGG